MEERIPKKKKKIAIVSIWTVSSWPRRARTSCTCTPEDGMWLPNWLEELNTVTYATPPMEERINQKKIIYYCFDLDSFLLAEARPNFLTGEPSLEKTGKTLPLTPG